MMLTTAVLERFFNILLSTLQLFAALSIGLAVLMLTLSAILIYQKPRQTDGDRPPAETVKPISDRLILHLIDPSNQTAAAQLYQPIGLWTGRLILPTLEQRQPDGAVLFEVHNADPAYHHLTGKVLTLKWSRAPRVQEIVRAVTVDVRFTPKTIESQKLGNVHPTRLNQLNRVGPLESLAGVRPQDDVTVMLHNPVLDDRTGEPALIISQEPVQITGRLVALVTIIQPVADGTSFGGKTKAEATQNPSSQIQNPQSRDRFLVRHFNKTSQQFDGPFDIIRIPQLPPDPNGIFPSTNSALEQSPLNSDGWYIYGEKNADGMFITQAIEPRALMRLTPNKVRLDLPACLTYIKKENWKNTASQKGTARTVLLAPGSPDPSEAVARWRSGDTAIVIHCFGGIGGKKAEPAPLGLVTGHFAYGIAGVVRDSLSGDLRFDIEYRQVYAHNSKGIVAGTIKWFSYMGDLQRGWLGQRPVCDILVKFDAVTVDYDFDGIKLSPMSEFGRQLAIMCDRYRTGDGTGASLVTPETSCVQDSNQALYITIKRIEGAIAANPRIQDWLSRNPTHPQTWQFEKLGSMARVLERNLVPLGIVQPDWRQNLKRVAGSNQPDSPIVTILKAITTWRTMLPRRAQDEIASILLKQGADLWVLRTNQVGGFDPDIAPAAPTALLGHRLK